MDPAMIDEEGDSVWTAVKVHFTAPVSGPAANRQGRIIVNIAPPGQSLQPGARIPFEMTPRIAVELLQWAGQWCCFDMMAFTPAHLQSPDGQRAFVGAVWFLDNYWPSIRRGIERNINLPRNRWPTTLNPPLRLVPDASGDSLYASVGVRAIDWTRSAILANVRSPVLSFLIPKRPRHADETPDATAYLDKEWFHRQREGWLAESGRIIGEMAPAAMDRLNTGGKVGADNWTSWNRGLQAELQAVEREIARNAFGTQPTPAKKKTPRRRTRGERPLTPLQQRAHELYAVHNGHIGKVAVAMGITRQSAKQHVAAADLKLKAFLPPPARATGRRQQMPTDGRGQHLTSRNDAPEPKD